MKNKSLKTAFLIAAALTVVPVPTQAFADSAKQFSFRRAVKTIKEKKGVPVGKDWVAKPTKFKEEGARGIGLKFTKELKPKRSKVRWGR
jgi:hypothetical protein